MANKILMPSGGQTTDEMVILKWYKKIGDLVKRGDILFEIETDKAILTVESFAAGTVLEIKYPEGVMVKTGEVVAVIGDPNEKTATPVPVSPNAGSLPKPSAVPSAPAATETAVIEVKSGSTNPARKILASPLAKNFARIENIKLEDVAGFVSRNLIRKIDVDQFLKSRQPSPAAAEPGDDHLISTSSMRRTIARRMKESIATSPHFIVAAEIDMTGVIQLRNKLNRNIDNGGGKISYNDIIMKVAARAVSQFPLVNSSYEGEKIRVHPDVHFGLAVALESGIVVPVVREVNKKSISEIAVCNRENIGKVKTNNFREPDISGGTITLSNLGMFGIDFFTAIINQPESCILAAGGIIKKVIVVNDEMVIREMMTLTASFDHRTVDGAVGAGFLMSVKAMLEDPELLLF